MTSEQPAASAPGGASPPTLPFTVEARCPSSRARRGVLQTRRGPVRTPAFMPVGTAAAIKGLTAEQAELCGADILLCNTYHLALRPGEEVVAAAGGLHRFMRWKRPILTDSGGYQVFSLGDLTEVDADGVTFRNHIDGLFLRLGPERAMEIQLALDSDIMMVFDECLPHTATVDEHRRSIAERTLPWGDRCLDLHPRDGRALFGIGQGGLSAELRREHMRSLVQRDFDGYAIGGLSVGETGDQFRAMIDASTELMPEGRPRYLMGVGSVLEILDAVALGVDMFDCVLPTRNARNAQALTFDGPIRLKNARFTRDFAVLEAGCPCPTCSGGYSRAYLRHLLMAKELTGATLMTLHNLAFMQRLMGGARAALARGQYEHYRERVSAPWKAVAAQS